VYGHDADHDSTGDALASAEEREDEVEVEKTQTG
jgi:hypothetical protein